MAKQLTKSKKLNNFQEATIEEIQIILHSITDGKSWKKAMRQIHEMTSKDNITC